MTTPLSGILRPELQGIRKRVARCILLLPILAAVACPARAEESPAVTGPGDPPTSLAQNIVSAEEMQAIYEQVKTPFKYGVVLKGEGGAYVDSPSVFRHEGRWYMIYIEFRGEGYETLLAVSDDLLNWRPLGKILEFSSGAWDSRQVAGYAALQDTDWNGSWSLLKHDGAWWMSYLGGKLSGYETAPLSIGIANTTAPHVARSWTRLPQNPVLTPEQPQARWFEKRTLYKSNVIADPDRRTGHSFVMYYNAATTEGLEMIGMAGSDDMVSWKRIGADPVVSHGSGITGDPQVVRIGDTWVMFYFGAHGRPGAFDRFACSRDLVHWTKWEGEDLVRPSEPYDREYAQKPWVIHHAGTVYHFYCAVGSEGRVIALATSRRLLH